MRALFRALVPASVREVLYFGRLSLRTLVTRGYGVDFRSSWMPVRVAAGYTTTRVVSNGLHLKVNLRDIGVAHGLYAARSYEPGETLFAQSAIQPGMVVVDIGANLGYFTTLFSKLTGPSGKVVAIEPDPYNHSLLKENTAQNHCSNVSLHQVALGEAPGSAQLNAVDDNFGNRIIGAPTAGVPSTTVTIETLDRILEGHSIRAVDFIKMDIQGFEPMALRGMLNTLKHSPSLRVLTECWPWGMARAGCSAEEFMDIFDQHGFAAYTVDDITGELKSIPYQDILKSVPASDPHAYINLVFQHSQSFE